MPPMKNSKRSVDGGWAWVILAASTLQFFVLIGFLKSFGIFFVAFLQKYDATSSEVSIVISIQTFVSTFASVVVLGVGTRYFTERTLVIIGAVLAALSQIGNAFAPNVYVLMATQGVLFGIGASVSQLAITLVLSHYFEKRRGFANSFANVGGSLGGLVWPVVLKKSLDYYGLQGTLILIAGVFLQVILCGALLRPLPSSQVRVQRGITEGEDIEETFALTSEEKTRNIELYEKPKEVHTLPNFKIRNARQSALEIGRRRTQSEVCYNSSESPFLQRTASAHDLNEDVGKLYVTSSLQALGWFPSIKESENNQESSSEETGNNTDQHKFFNWALFKNPLFYIFTLSSIFNAAAAGLPVNYIPPFARDFHVSDENIALLVAISAASDLFSRFGLVFVADSQKLKRHHLLALTMFLNGVSCLLAPLYNSFPYLVLYSVLYGIFGQTYFSLFPVIIVDFLGLPNLRHGLTSVCLTVGSSVVIASVIIGKLRDLTGSYLSSFYFMGASAVLASLILMMEPLGRRHMMKGQKVDKNETKK